jgi:hypothetical protein
MTIHEWRALIGPRYEPATAAHRFEWWTPSNLDNTATLDAELASGATSIVLAEGSGSFDSRGGVWVAGNAAGEAWEYVAYTGKSSTNLTGCIREPSATREHNGHHTGGAVVRQWWPIEDDSGTLRIAEQLSETLSAITWNASIEGIKAPPPPLRPDHVVVVQTRERGTDSWTTYLVGFVRNPTVRDDWRRLRQWKIEIVSVSSILATQQAPGIRIGDFNLLKYGSANTDTVLADPRKESASGEYNASSPVLTGASAIDDDPDTLWIAERFVGTPAIYTPPPGNDGDNAYEKIFLTQAYIHRWPGESEPTRWLEWCVKSQTFLALALISSDEANSVSVGDLTGWSSDTGDTIVLCESEATFKEKNPHAAPTKLIEISSVFFDNLDPADDAVGWFNFTGDSIFSAAYSWGEANRIYADGGSSEPWAGDPIPAPGPGQIIRYNYDETPAQLKDHWIVDYVDMAGYKANDGDDPWIVVKLPLLDLVIADDMTSSVPGAGSTLAIVDSSGTPSTIGLEDTGTIQVGTEQITYSARDGSTITISARGANSTVAAVHEEGDQVRVVADGQATLGRLIERIEWSRTQAPYPKNFKLYRSLFDSPANPGSSSFLGAWTSVADVTDHASVTYGIDLSPAKRATAILMTVDKMSADPARVRINDLRAISSQSEYETGHAVDATDADETIAVIAAASEANASINNTGPSTLINGVTTEYGPLWTILADMADYGGCIVDCTRTGPIDVAPNPLSADTLTASATIDEDEISEIEYVQPPYAPVGYVSLVWLDTDGAEQPAVEYPASHAPTAVPVDLTPAAYPDLSTATAAAKRVYILMRYPTTFIVQLATAQPAIRPATVLQLGWSLEYGTEALERLVVVVGADHELAAGRWTTVLQLRQVDRESPG